MTKVSVIIPNYNHAPFLVQRIESVFNQTYQDFEVIFLDDCSTDNSRDIIEQYRNHPKVSHILYNEVNSGSPFKQWEKGISLSKGEWIWIAESDDDCTLNFLEKLVNAIEEGFGLVTCRTEKINEYGEIDEPGYFLPDAIDLKRWHSNFVNDGISEINRALKYLNSIPNASAVIFYKSLVRYLNMSLEFKTAGDWYFWINCLSETKVKYISTPLAFHRFHSQTTRSLKTEEQERQRMNENLQCINLAHQIIDKNNKKNDLDPIQYKRIFHELFKLSIGINQVLKFKYIPVKILFGYWFYINERTKRFKNISKKIKLKTTYYVKKIFLAQ